MNKPIELKVVGEPNILKCMENDPIYVAYSEHRKHALRVKSLENKDYIYAKDLNYRYQFILVPKRKFLTPIDLGEDTDDLLYLIGWCLSDGNVSKTNNRVSICLQGDQMSMALKLQSIIDKFCPENEKSPNNLIFNKCKLENHGTYIMLIKGSVVLKEFLLKFGCYPNNKKIPVELTYYNNLMPLVMGYLEGNGHQKRNAKYDGYKREVLECATKYKFLLRQLRQILIDNDIWSSLNERKARNANSKDQLNMTISGNYVNKTLSFYPSLKFSNTEVNTTDKQTALLDSEGFWSPISKILK